MKVKMGKPHEWIGPYQLASMLQYVGVSEDRCHQIGKWLSNDHKSWLEKACTWIHNKKPNRIKVHIDRWDTWGMDSTLAYIILPMLKQLRDTKHGSPGSMPAFEQTSNSAQLSFDFYEEGDEAAWEAGHQQWKEILDEMIWGFEQINTDWEDQYWRVHPELDLDDYPEDEGKDIIPVRWKVEGDCDYEGMRKHGERIQAAMELFGKYYLNLWD